MHAMWGVTFDLRAECVKYSRSQTFSSSTRQFSLKEIITVNQMTFIGNIPAYSPTFRWPPPAVSGNRRAAVDRLRTFTEVTDRKSSSVSWQLALCGDSTIIDRCRDRSSSLEPSSSELIPDRSGTDKWRRVANDARLALADTSGRTIHTRSSCQFMSCIVQLSRLFQEGWVSTMRLFELRRLSQK